MLLTFLQVCLTIIQTLWAQLTPFEMRIVATSKTLPYYWYYHANTYMCTKGFCLLQGLFSACLFIPWASFSWPWKLEDLTRNLWHCSWFSYLSIISDISKICFAGNVQTALNLRTSRGQSTLKVVVYSWEKSQGAGKCRPWDVHSPLKPHSEHLRQIKYLL